MWDQRSKKNKNFNRDDQQCGLTNKVTGNPSETNFKEQN